MNQHIKSFQTKVSRRQVMIGAAGLSFAIALGDRADAAVFASERTGTAMSPWVSIIVLRLSKRSKGRAASPDRNDSGADRR